MKWLLPLFILPISVWAKPVVLVSYYDAFGSAPFNNSEKVAKAIEQKFNFDSSEVSIKLCALETKFDTSYAQLENCIKNLDEKPVMVLGLGESNCNFKIETVVRNLDKTKGPDNAGVERNNTVIVPEAPSAFGLKYPLPQMYCALLPNERKEIELSNSAGSFVCNNTALQASWYYSELPSGFIHVPASSCRDLPRKTNTAIKNLELMIPKAVEVITSGSSSMEQRLPIKKVDLDLLRSQYQNKDKCLHEFYKRARGVDEKNFWLF